MIGMLLDCCNGATQADTVMEANPRVQAFADWCSTHHILTPDISDLGVEQRQRVSVLHEIETLKERVFAYDVFLKPLAEPHDELMNRIAGMCNYDYHRVGSHQCGNASGRFIAEVFGFWQSNLSASHERTFVQAALCRMSHFATIADHKERFIASCDEPANDICNEGVYAMLQMYVYDKSQYEELP